MTSRSIGILSLVFAAFATCSSVGCNRHETDQGDAADGDGGKRSGAPPPASQSLACDQDGAVANIDDADYDQSCTSVSDCVPVPKGDVCYDCIRVCSGGVVSRTAEAQYRSDIRKLAGPDPHASCHCPNQLVPCCAKGQCRNDGHCDE
jgi:hypothetical protein